MLSVALFAILPGMSATKTLIIGGTGHVSGAVARIALNHGHEVWTVTRGQRPATPGATAIIADRHDSAAISAAIADVGTDWDLVVDCICYDLAELRQDVELFRERAKHFVLVSTDFVYDPSRRKFPQPEDAPTLSGGAEGSLSYGSKKRQCELELANTDTGDMVWTVFRPCHIYGPTSELGCLPLVARDPGLIDKLRNGSTLQLVGGGYLLQQPILADDLAEAMVSVLGNRGAYGRIFNAAGPDIVESRRYYEIIAEILGVDITIEEIPIDRFREKEPGRAPFLCHRIYDLTNMDRAGIAKPSTSIDDGLRMHVEGLIASIEK